MKEFEADYIEKLVDIMRNNELTEVTLEDENRSIYIKSNGYKPIVKEILKEEENVEKSVLIEEDKAQTENKNLVPIISGMIGTFYSRPKPDEKPFVSVGDNIKEGDVICIIETIKLINKITSDISGRVAEICIEDGKPVEYGQVIMYIKKN